MKSYSYPLYTILFLGFILSQTSCREKEGTNPESETGIAKMYIETQNGEAIGKEDYVPATVSFYPANANDGDTLNNIMTKIKGRGNSTWTMPKKPYKLKMDQKTSFFGMPPQKKWVLLANYADKSLIRNYLAYRLANQIGSPYAPAYHFLEIYVNGKHQGNYMMSDQIEVGASRVNIPELNPTDNDPQTITGGYLLEIDHYVPDSDDPYFTAHHFPIGIKSPEEPSNQQLAYINNYVNEAEDVLYGADFKDPATGFRKYFDEESMIKWFIVSEIFKNPDSKDYSSIFFFKNRGGKLTMGPIWDFDLSTGNATYCIDCMEPTGWYVLHSYWFERMWQDPDFQEKVKISWQEYKPEIENILPEIDRISKLLAASEKENFALWPDFNDPDWAVVQGLESYQQQINYLKKFLQKRIAWIDNQLSH